jgi:hypothetical protein
MEWGLCYMVRWRRNYLLSCCLSLGMDWSVLVYIVRKDNEKHETILWRVQLTFALPRRL